MNKEPSAVSPYPIIGGVLLSLVYAYLIALHGFVGWIAWDEGSLGQMAERVLFGELPHIDYDCMYTGLLSLLHALWYQVTGVELPALRWFLFLSHYLFLAAAYYATLRISRSVVWAVVATLLLMLWGVLQYPTSMPSWQSLHLTIAGAFCLILYERKPHRAWLLLAGVFCGLSILVKITGLYWVMALGYYWLYRNQSDCARAYGWSTSRRFSGGAAFIIAALFSPPLLVGVLCLRPFQLDLCLYYVLPFVGLSAAVSYRELFLQSGPFLERMLGVLRLLVPYLVGLAGPILAYLGFYAYHGGVGNLLNGVFVQPFTRLSDATHPPPHIGWLLVLGLAILGVSIASRLGSRRVQQLVAVALFTVVLAGCFVDQIYLGVWECLRWAVPVACFIPFLTLAVERNQLDKRSHANLVLLAGALASLNLLQYPFAEKIYFLYVIPGLVLLVMATGVAFRQVASGKNWTIGALALSLILFAWVYLEKAPRALFGFAPYEDYVGIDAPRDGLKVDPSDYIFYYELGAYIERYAKEDDYIYAFPDCPEVYFLYEKRNPSRALFDFLGRNEDEYADAAMLAQLEAKNVNLAVLHLKSYFSKSPSQATVDRLQQRFPYGKILSGGKFLVLWRKPEAKL